MTSRLLNTAFLLLAFVAPVLSATVQSGADPTLNLAPMEFHGEIAGIQVQLNGTIEEVLAQFHKLHPEIPLSATAPSNETDLELSGALGARSDATSLDDVPPPHHECCPMRYWPDWVWAYGWAIEQGIKYLRRHQGCCGVPARTCVRISCSLSSAIYACNDNYFATCLDCNNYATAAWDMMQMCYYTDNDGLWDGPCGQEFAGWGAWNVVVRRDNC